jgi:signal transduction histidine kinase
MKSVYVKSLLWLATILLVCLVLFMGIYRYAAYDNFAEGGPLAGMINRQLDGAVRAYNSGGRNGIASYIAQLEATYPQNRYYFLANGIDPITRSDLRELRTMAWSWWERFHLGAPRVAARSSADGQYTLFLIFPGFGANARVYTSYYIVLLLALGVLCWALVFQFAAPLNNLVEVVQRFGEGQFSARVKTVRRDGIGDLGRAFNRMADSIQTLRATERQLLQDISHELRSPLARMSVAAELALSSADREAAVAQIHMEIGRLTELLEGLIQVARAESDPAVQKLSHVVLDELVRDVIKDCTIEASARRCKLRFTGMAGLALEADRELLRRAIENPLRNAIRYSPEGSNIEIELTTNGSQAAISVRDYGPGVPATLLNHIFDPFFRVDNSRDMTTGGIGLGLSITKRAIDLHRGKIWGENAEPGLRVCMALPLQN